MFKKIMFKSFAGAAATGTALSMALVATPAVTTAAPEIDNVSCHGYPANASTTTQMSLQRVQGPYGASNGVSVRVSSDEAGQGTPAGTVRIRLFNGSGSVIRSWNPAVSNGTVSVSLPSRLASRQTYRVTARYNPSDCAGFTGSSAADAFYTVRKAPTRTAAHAPNLSRTKAVRVNVSVGSVSQHPVVGKARVILKRRGVVLARRTVELSGESARAWFGKRRAGYYDVIVKYLGSDHFTRSSHATDLRVFRR